VRRTVAALLLVLGSGCGAIRAQDKEIRSVADTLAEALVKHGKKDAAVVDFTDLRGNVTELGRHLAEQLSVALATNDKGIDVVDRMHLRSIMQENKLGTSGLIDPSTVRKLGQIAGVGVLVTGSLTPFGDSVELTVKALDSATARIVGASTIDIPRTKAIQDLLDRDIGSASVADAGGGQESATSPSRGGAGVERLSRESEEIVFTLNECRLSGETVRCDIEIANKGRDRVVLLGGETAETRIIDPSGHEYDVEGLRLGTSECRHCNVRSTLVQNVPMAAGISFVEVPSEVSQISLLELRYRVEGGRGWTTVQFRGVPVSLSTGPPEPKKTHWKKTKAQKTQEREE